MSKARPKTTTKPAKQASPDAALIGACVRFAQVIAGAQAAFKADPDGDCAYAEPIDTRAHGQAQKALSAASAAAQTTAGINAKARLVPFILDHDGANVPNSPIHLRGSSAAFMLAFASDVQSFTGKAAEIDERTPAEGGAA